MMEIYIIRHGETDGNKKNQLQGRRNILLNEKGRAQAKEAREKLKDISFDVVYSSPLDRAKETAQIVTNQSCPILFDDRLLEMDYGPYEGVDLSHPPKEIIEFFQDFTHNKAPEGMEQLSSVVQRSRDFLNSLVHGHHDQTILLSTHAIVMKGLLEVLISESKGSFWSKYIGNCAIYHTTWNGHEFINTKEL